jgi:arginyl-tRNA synthetase
VGAIAIALIAALGNIAYEDLKAEALKKTYEETKKRHLDWSEKKVMAVSRVLAFGALKFEMIKVSGEKVITFDMETALRFDGYTSAYLQYTYARIKSMTRKITPAVKKAKVNYSLLEESREKKLAMLLARFPEVVVIAGETYQPSEIARYLHELGQLFNDYYHLVPILNDTSLAPSLAKARLELAVAASLVIKKGLDLLGVETVEEM